MAMPVRMIGLASAAAMTCTAAICSDPAVGMTITAMSLAATMSLAAAVATAIPASASATSASASASTATTTAAMSEGGRRSEQHVGHMA